MVDNKTVVNVEITEHCPHHQQTQVVGEYSYVLEDTDTEEILEKITSLLMRTFEDRTTTNWVVSSVTKLVARLGSMPDNVQSQVAVYLASTDTDVQQVQVICTLI